MKLSEYLIEKSAPHWERVIKHPFGAMMVNNQLSEQQFKKYLEQDILYLIDYLKAFGLLLSKSTNQSQRNFCVKCLISTAEGEAEMQKDLFSATSQNKKAWFCQAYCAWFYQIAVEGDWLDLLVALAPCPIAYYLFGQHHTPTKATKPLYQKWFSHYQNSESREMYEDFLEQLNYFQISDLSAHKLQKLVTIFTQAVQLEDLFFTESLKL